MVAHPTPQGINSQTFHAAPFQHGLSVAGLYEYHAINSPKHPVFTYTDTASGISYDILYADGWRDICKVANIVQERYSQTTHYTQYTKDPQKRPVIGILALAGALNHLHSPPYVFSSDMTRLSQLHLYDDCDYELGIYRFPLVATQ